MSRSVTIIGKSKNGFHRNSLLNASKKYNLNAEIRTLNTGTNLENEARKFGDAIIWRSSDLGKKSERASLAPFVKDKLLINESLFLYPFVAHKYYQQSVFKATPSLKKYSIPTYKNQTLKSIERLIDKKLLSYPLIAKPNKGDRGEGIEYIANPAGLNALFAANEKTKKYIFQDFINNDNDWRVIVIGGVPVGALKRVAKDGDFLNNISRGAESSKETNETVLSTLFEIAVKAAAVFNLRFTGVDIIYDKNKKEYKILEVNTAPQWDGDRGFASVVGLDIADKLMSYIDSMLDRKATAFPELVKKYYVSNIEFSKSALFHFHSRLWLWTDDANSRKVLDELKEWYIGKDNKQTKQILTAIIERSGTDNTVNENKKFRKKYFEKYSTVKAMNALLFKVIFCDSVYGVDIRPLVREKIKDTQFIELFDALIKDKDAQRVLSTHAANYFYLLKNYFKNRITLSSRVLVDPYEVIETAMGYNELVTTGELSANEALKQKIHLLTHIILGESRFYQRSVSITGYKDTLIEIEGTIRSNYTQISLDNKCEFLVCAQIVGVKSSLKEIILDEAENSKSWAGNFIVDMLNVHTKATNHNLRSSEHRNVLYVMASTNFIKNKIKRTNKTKATQKNLPLIGRLARVQIKELGGIRTIARTDTGATTSSIHCSSVSETKGGLKVNFGSDIFGFGGSHEYLFDKYEKTEVKRQGLGRSQRYIIKLTIVHNGKSKKVDFTLADRDDMLYPVLLGRNYLANQYLVDTGKQFIITRSRKA